MVKKGPYKVKELKSLPQGAQVWGKFLVLDKLQKKTKDGKIMINLKIGDDSGEIDVVAWDNCMVEGTLAKGTVVGCVGDLGFYSNRLQVTARRIKILPQEDPAHYLKLPDIDINELVKEFEQYYSMIEDKYLKLLLDRIFTQATRQLFFKAPAAKRFHHNYQGGLLEHTVAVTKLCLQVSQNYPGLNRDLLVTGALLHDIGKIKEYETRITPEYTPEGKLLGHIVMGNEMVTLGIQALHREEHEFPGELEWMVKHMILSHHGIMEFGSPVIPLFPEALLLHMMDNLDAKIHVFQTKINDDTTEDLHFTSFDGLLGQTYFKYKYPGNN